VAGFAVVAAVVAILGIAGMFVLVLRVSQGIRREERRLGTLHVTASGGAARTARRWTGVGARWA
jgi:hypothetical protein